MRCGANHLWKVSSAASRRLRHPILVEHRDIRLEQFTGRAEELRELAASLPSNGVAPLSDIARLAGMHALSLYRFIPKRLARLAEVPISKNACQFYMNDFLSWVKSTTARNGAVMLRGVRLEIAIFDKLGIEGKWLTQRELTTILLRRDGTRQERHAVQQMLNCSKAERRQGTATQTMHVYPVDEVLYMLADHLAEQAHASYSGCTVMPLETVITTSEMSAKLTDDRDNERSNWAVAVAEPILGADQPLPVDPYALGAWLGDGHSRAAAITSADPAIISFVEVSGYPIRRIDRRSDTGLASTYFFDNLAVDLKAIGLAVTRTKPANKHIPPIYIRASKRQRLALLQGLMDTDGYVNENGHCELSFCSERLTNDALELIRSLGIKASVHDSDAAITEDDPDNPNQRCRRVTGTQWRIHFTTSMPVFRLERKAQRLPKETRDTQRWLYVKNIRVTDSQPMRCLVVNHPEHLYLTDQFIPTHNSMSIISMLLQLATSNTPEDLEFRLVDPKTSLVPFRNLAHVSHFVMSLPGRDRHRDFLDLLHSTVREMENRYERINELNLEDFTQARSMGQMTELPYVIVVIEEASLMLVSEDKGAERAIVREVGQIANLGRGAGVYLVLATQYPSNKSIPNHLREQFSRIGFKVQDHVASNIIINESGLEDLSRPGQGKMRCGGLFVPFRGFFLHPGDGPTELDVAGEEELRGVVHHYGRPPDRTIILSHLPKGPRDRQVGSKGVWKPFTIAPIPEGIWNKPSEGVAEPENSET